VHVTSQATETRRSFWVEC